ncbi:hypothetical protein WP2W18C05_16950 [Aeromonas sp. WP2-W18-CRE-05]|nr:hypothetical protein WP2W18C05_16950 [Aeromonas sp. WP2-W18-CRE-05]
MLAQPTALLYVDNGLEHAAEDIRVDFTPIHGAAFKQDPAAFLTQFRDWLIRREQSAIDVGECRQMHRQILPLSTAWFAIEHREQLIEEEIQIATIFFCVTLDGRSKLPFAKNARIFGKQAKQQASQKDVQSVDVSRLAKVILSADKIKQLAHFLSSFDIGRIFAADDSLLKAYQRQEEAIVAVQLIQINIE